MSRLLSIAVILLASKTLLAQEIEDGTVAVFHGLKGGTMIYYGNKVARPDPKKWIRIPVEKGSQGAILLLNPNPIHYEYDVKKEEKDIQEDVPDLAAFLKVFQTIIDAQQITLPMSTLHVGGLPGAPAASKETDIYHQKVIDLSSELTKVKTLIESSDDPGLADEARKNGNVSLQKIVNDIYALPNIKDPEHLFHENLLTALKQHAAKSAPELAAASATATFIEASFNAMNEALVAQIKKVRTSIDGIEYQKKYSFDADTKMIEATLSTKSLNAGKTKRDEGDLLKVRFLPYRGVAVELIPWLSAIQFDEYHDFAVSNGVITENVSSKLEFRASLMAAVTLPAFDPYKRSRVGFGIGYAHKNGQAFAKNLYFGGLISLREYIRFGIGVGSFQAPYKLNGATVGGALPPDVSDINKVIEYQNKIGLIFSLTVVGLKFYEKK